jgi:hypothetical protein
MNISEPGESEKLSPATPPEAPPPASSAATPQEAAPQKPEKTRSSFLRRALRGLLLLLIVLAVGANLAIFTLYVPTRQELAEANQKMSRAATQYQAEMQKATQEVGRLSSQSAQSADLQSQLNNAQLHVTLLKARLDIAAAQLALANQQPEQAKLALSKTPDLIQSLGSLLPADQRKAVDEMQSRLKLVVDEISTNGFAAKLDLEVVNNLLMKLEETLEP